MTKNNGLNWLDEKLERYDVEMFRIKAVVNLWARQAKQIAVKEYYKRGK